VRPAFDSDRVFSALLGDASLGRWLIAPTEEITKILAPYWDNRAGADPGDAV